MNEQLTLDGPARRDEGTTRVWSHADEQWKANAWDAICALATLGDPFTSEQVRAIVGDPDKPNAMGALFLRASKAGIIHRTGRVRRATRPSLHATDLPEWEGCV